MNTLVLNCFQILDVIMNLYCFEVLLNGAPRLNTLVINCFQMLDVVIRLYCFQVLLNGAPGCGKTSCVTVASEAMRLLGYCVQTTRISLNRGADDMGGHWDGRFVNVQWNLRLSIQHTFVTQLAVLYKEVSLSQR